MQGAPPFRGFQRTIDAVIADRLQRGRGRERLRQRWLRRMIVRADRAARQKSAREDAEDGGERFRNPAGDAARANTQEHSECRHDRVHSDLWSRRFSGTAAISGPMRPHEPCLRMMAPLHRASAVWQWRASEVSGKAGIAASGPQWRPGAPTLRSRSRIWPTMKRREPKIKELSPRPVQAASGCCS